MSKEVNRGQKVARTVVSTTFSVYDLQVNDGVPETVLLGEHTVGGKLQKARLESTAKELYPNNNPIVTQFNHISEKREMSLTDFIENSTPVKEEK